MFIVKSGLFFICLNFEMKRWYQLQNELENVLNEDEGTYQLSFIHDQLVTGKLSDDVTKTKFGIKTVCENR